MNTTNSINWPIKLSLVSLKQDFLNNDLLCLAADCTAFACKNFHARYIKDHTLLTLCPRLEDKEELALKLSEVLLKSRPKEIEIVKMTMPCCVVQKILDRALEIVEKEENNFHRPRISIKAINQHGLELMPSFKVQR